MLPELPKIYWYLSLLRIFLVFIPQLGYIHPDEYFQSIEVHAGDVFQLEHNRPWEFNLTFPIRSMTASYFTIGMAYRLANVLDHFLKGYVTSTIITPYLLVVAPRLLMCVLSFLVDASIYKICINNNEKYKSKLVILASSYVMIVFGTRTFSNTLELILFAILLYYVCESLTFSNTLIKKREYLNYRYETSRSTVEKVQFHKLRLLLTSDSLRNCFQVSTITVMGFFNRPTFLAFAVFPVFFWLYRGMGNKLITPMNYHLRILVLIACSIPSILLNILIDSLYYGYLTWGEIGVLQISINNFVFTPLNFVKYNLDSSNLAKHGLHPRFLHVLVNMPLLYNVLAVFTLYGFFQAGYNFVTGKHHLLPTVRSIKGLMMLSYIAPLGILSLFPHQEPRFLIPLIIPLIYLHSSQILPEKDNIIIKLDHPVSKKFKIQPTKQDSNIYMKLWLVINLIFVIFFGFLHQGGVYHATEYLSKDMKLESPKTEYYIVTSHIYTLPESLFLQKSSNMIHYAKSTKYTVPKRYFLYEEGSTDLAALVKDLQNIHKRIKNYRQKNKQKFKLLLLIPGSLEDRLNYIAVEKNLGFRKIRSFYPHISTEAFPELGPEMFHFLNSNFELQVIYRNLQYSFSRFASSFGLCLYEIL